jgi:hypothetical protein
MKCARFLALYADDWFTAIRLLGALKVRNLADRILTVRRDYDVLLGCSLDFLAAMEANFYGRHWIPRSRGSFR